jgi:hypothetical protein
MKKSKLFLSFGIGLLFTFTVVQILNNSDATTSHKQEEKKEALINKFSHGDQKLYSYYDSLITDGDISKDNLAKLENQLERAFISYCYSFAILDLNMLNDGIADIQNQFYTLYNVVDSTDDEALLNIYNLLLSLANQYHVSIMD